MNIVQAPGPTEEQDQLLWVSSGCEVYSASERRMKEIYRTAAIQSLPMVCNDARNISYERRKRLTFLTKKPPETLKPQGQLPSRHTYVDT
ncbi:hypothetical protein AV530_018662 [Patagioenas fasciata monilis]|uniref:Uncharacterized protein n=1 Tax=Patagioenas fasciata monilis TaxID=372326 RepID=A0A1V4JJ52_PATFA|nr:hypothetical protein AV530_018662 [Patagioenas fasciata monilis]